MTGSSQVRAFDAAGKRVPHGGRSDRATRRAGPRARGGRGRAHDADGNPTERVDPDGARWRYGWARRRPVARGAAPRRRPRRVRLRRARSAHGEARRRARRGGVGRGRGAPRAGGGAPTRTWYFEPESFVPPALDDGGRWCGAVPDVVARLGALRRRGDVAWRAQLDLYGAARADRRGGPGVRGAGRGSTRTRRPGYYNRHRYYSAGARRVRLPRPAGLAAGVNARAYVPDPLTARDPCWGSSCSSRAGTTDTLFNAVREGIASRPASAARAQRGGLPDGRRSIHRAVEPGRRRPLEACLERVRPLAGDRGVPERIPCTGRGPTPQGPRLPRSAPRCRSTGRTTWSAARRAPRRRPSRKTATPSAGAEPAMTPSTGSTSAPRCSRSTSPRAARSPPPSSPPPPHVRLLAVEGPAPPAARGRRRVGRALPRRRLPPRRRLVRRAPPGGRAGRGTPPPGATCATSATRARAATRLGVAFSADGLHSTRTAPTPSARRGSVGRRARGGDARWGAAALALDPAGEVLAIVRRGQGEHRAAGSWGGADFRSSARRSSRGSRSVGAFGPDGAALALFGGGGRAQLRVVDLDAWEACLALDLDGSPRRSRISPWAAPRAMAFTPTAPPWCAAGRAASSSRARGATGRRGLVRPARRARDGARGGRRHGPRAGGRRRGRGRARRPRRGPPCAARRLVSARALEARFGRVAPGRVGDDAAYVDSDVLMMRF